VKWREGWAGGQVVRVMIADCWPYLGFRTKFLLLSCAS